jgi:hypothetical protein
VTNAPSAPLIAFKVALQRVIFIVGAGLTYLFEMLSRIWHPRINQGFEESSDRQR